MRKRFWISSVVVLMIGISLNVWLSGRSRSSHAPPRTVIQSLPTDKRIRQLKLLDNALAAHERGEFLGALASDYQELFDLADVTRIFRAGNGAAYEFRPENAPLPERVKHYGNHEGPGWLRIYVDGDTPSIIRSIESIYTIY